MLLALSCGRSYAQSPLTVPYNEVHTVAGPTVAVPLEYSFNITTAGTYTVNLIDIGAALTPPAPVGSVKLAITSGGSLVTLTSAAGSGSSSASSSSSAGAPSELVGAGSATFTGSTGTYVIHVVGTPGTTAGSGPIGVQITGSGGNSIAGFSGTLALPSMSIPSNIGVLDASVPIPAGTYTIQLADLAFPQTLNTLAMTLVGVATGKVVNLTAAGSTPATLPQDNYNVVAAGCTPANGQTTCTSAAPGGSGLFSVSITSTTAASGSAPLYASTVPVGAVGLIASPTLSVASYTLTQADLQYPAGLTTLGSIVVLNGAAVGGPLTTTPTTSTSFTAGVAGTYQVFAVATPTSNTGSYALSLQSSTNALAVDVARAVANPGSGYVAFSYDTTASSSASQYQLDLADFGYPSPLTNLTVAAAQGIGPRGTPGVLGNPSASPGAGSQTVTPAAGAVSLLVFAQPGAGMAGLFGLDWAESGGATPAFETTQAVGALFSTRTVNIATGGNYQISVADLGFPESFGTLAVLVTRGSSTIGSIFSAGSIVFPATPGNYDVSFLAQPGNMTMDDAGTYFISLATAPPSPVISSFTSNPTSVSAGGSVTLDWSTQNATSCSLAGGGFNNTSEPATGSVSGVSVTATTTFTLNCTGAGGNTSQTVTVAVSSTGGGGGGGGGGGLVGADLLMILLAAAALRLSSRRASPARRA